MEKEYEKLYHQYERTHFWFKARRKYILNYLKKKYINKNEPLILDIGCSSGILLHELAECGFDKNNLYGVDISSTAVENCIENGLRNVYVMDAQQIELPQQFDVIISSDCLEHLENDEMAIQNWYQLLKNDGILIVFVPAFMFLWSNHDVVNRHFRRYTKKELKEKLTKPGFEIQKASYWNFFLFFPLALFSFVSKLVRRKGSNGNQNNLQKMNFFNTGLFLLLNFENCLLKFMKFPVGISVFGVVKKSN